MATLCDFLSTGGNSSRPRFEPKNLLLVFSVSSLSIFFYVYLFSGKHPPLYFYYHFINFPTVVLLIYLFFFNFQSYVFVIPYFFEFKQTKYQDFSENKRIRKNMKKVQHFFTHKSLLQSFKSTLFVGNNLKFNQTSLKVSDDDGVPCVLSVRNRKQLVHNKNSHNNRCWFLSKLPNGTRRESLLNESLCMYIMIYYTLRRQNYTFKSVMLRF